jgi:hypothetical protein
MALIAGAVYENYATTQAQWALEELIVSARALTWCDTQPRVLAFQI